MRILFVCLGNICRSPTAEAVLRRMAADRGFDLEIDSAGTGDYHIGSPPYGPAISAGKARGYDLSPLRARQVVPADFTSFDLVLAMDESNLADLVRLAPPGGTRVRLFLEGVPGLSVRNVPDPYYTGDFEQALDLIESAASHLLDQLQ